MERLVSRWQSWAVVVGASAIFALACSSCSSSTHPPNSGDLGGGAHGGPDDASVSSDAATDGPLSSLTCAPADGGGGCNALGFCTDKVDVVENKSAPPTTLAGGPPPSGLYALTKYEFFGGVGTGAYFRQTMRFTARADSDAGTSGTDAASDASADGSVDPDAGSGIVVDWQNLVVSNDGPTPSTNTGSVTFAGTALRIDTTCPTMATGIFSAQYASTANTLTMLAKDPKGVSRLTYTKISN